MQTKKWIPNFKLLLLSLCFSLNAAASNAVSFVSSDRVVVDLDNVFIPRVGFDDNDNVQIVVEGHLPNACYTLVQTETELDNDIGALNVRQMALKATGGICAEEASLPPDLAAQRYFWKVVDVGQVNAGEYVLNFKTKAPASQKTFQVQVAPTNEIDSLSYLFVSQAYVKPVVSASQGFVEIIVSGELTSSCAVLNGSPVVQKIDDVYVVMIDITRSAEFCMPASRPFYQSLKVKVPALGRYLLHVRSAGGDSKNSIFEVVE